MIKNISIPRTNRGRSNPYMRLNGLRSNFNLYNPYRVPKEDKYLDKSDLGYISILENDRRKETA